MESTGKSHGSRVHQRSEMADSIILMAIPSFSGLGALKAFTVHDLEEFKENFECLVAKGCEPTALMAALLLANTIQVPPLPVTNKVKALARSMRQLAAQIQKTEEMSFLILQDRKVVKASGYGPEDDEVEDWTRAFPQLCLPKWLEKRAEMYEEWLRMAAQRVPPRCELLGRARRVCPVLYVNWATKGHPHHERVSNLLRSAGIARISPRQLIREVTAFRSDYPISTATLVSTLSLVHDGVVHYDIAHQGAGNQQG
jgi:hypothetical protein